MMCKHCHHHKGSHQWFHSTGTLGTYTSWPCRKHVYDGQGWESDGYCSCRDFVALTGLEWDE